MSNYLSLHVRVIWNDAHWRLMAVQEAEDGEQETEHITGGIFPVPGDWQDGTDIAATLTHIAVDLVKADQARSH